LEGKKEALIFFRTSLAKEIVDACEVLLMEIPF